MKVGYNDIKGRLKIKISKEGFGDEKWDCVNIYGDPKGLKSFASVLLQLAKLNQNKCNGLPTGNSEHIHLYPEIDLTSDSNSSILGRLDRKKG